MEDVGNPTDPILLEKSIFASQYYTLFALLDLWKSVKRRH